MTMSRGKITFEILGDSTTIPNVLLDHYKELGLSERETLFLVVLLRLNAKKATLSFKNTAKESNYSEKEVKELVPTLIDKGFLSLSGEGLIGLDGLADKFVEVWSMKEIKAEQRIKKEKAAIREDKVFSGLYLGFEREMGRPLSPIEGERISYWYHNEKIPAELIEEGLKRAVLLGKYNFSYIEAILFNWQKQGIATVDQVKKAEEERRTVPKAREKKGERSFRGSQEDIYSDDIFEEL